MKRIISLIVALVACVSLSAQGTAYNDRVLESKILGQTTHYSIYLPESYETSSIDYPVLYLLHGGGDNWKDWLLKGQAAEIADSQKKNAGIGLSVCASIIKAHGGTIKAENVKSGGAVFRFALETENASNDTE